MNLHNPIAGAVPWKEFVKAWLHKAQSWNSDLDSVEPHYRGILDLLIQGADKRRYQVDERADEDEPRLIKGIVGHTVTTFVRVGGILVTEEHTQCLWRFTEESNMQSIAEKKDCNPHVPVDIAHMFRLCRPRPQYLMKNNQIHVFLNVNF